MIGFFHTLSWNMNIMPSDKIQKYITVLQIFTFVSR